MKHLLKFNESIPGGQDSKEDHPEGPKHPNMRILKPWFQRYTKKGKQTYKFTVEIECDTPLGAEDIESELSQLKKIGATSIKAKKDTSRKGTVFQNRK